MKTREKYDREFKQMARLKKELRETQMEHDILKKAVSIFSKSNGEYSNSLRITAPYFPLGKCARLLK